MNDCYNQYQENIDKLNEFQMFSLVKQIPSELVLHRLSYTIDMCRKLDIQESDLNKLNIIHITGTKGKGSTSSLIESILRHHGYLTGLFSSPHLIEVRERIKINGKSLPYDKFNEYFQYCYETLVDKWSPNDKFEKPSYFQFLTCMMFYTFCKEKVQTGIVEVGIGGQYDFTNIIPNPAACGITSLGLDHCSILGYTLEEIAWQKSGIFKPSAVAFIIKPESESVLNVIKKRAIEKNVQLCVVPIEKKFLDLNSNEIEPGLEGEVQYINSSLALQIAKYWIDKFKNPDLDKLQWVELNTDKRLENGVPILKPVVITENFKNGLTNCVWPGRNQIIESENKRVTYYLDGAHTLESIDQFLAWFKKQQLKKSNDEKKEKNVLLFNFTGERDASLFLEKLLEINFDCVAFSKLNAYPLLDNEKISQDAIRKMPSAQLDTDKKYHKLIDTYTQLHQKKYPESSSNCKIFENILEALNWLANSNDDYLKNELKKYSNNNETQLDSINKQPKQEEEEKINVLITGSLYLVGLTLKVLNFKIN